MRICGIQRINMVSFSGADAKPQFGCSDSMVNLDGTFFTGKAVFCLRHVAFKILGSDGLV